MTDNKFTDAEIIKAFESCQVEVYCLGGDCPYFGYNRCARRLLDDTLSLINRPKARIDLLEKDNKYLAMKLRKARAEAIKEFAERLKERLVEESYDDVQFFKVVGESEIDNLVKEMVGDGDDC